MANEMPPCRKDCERRSPTCHGECRDYGEFAAMQRAKKAAYRESKERRYDWTKGKDDRMNRKQVTRWWK